MQHEATPKRPVVFRPLMDWWVAIGIVIMLCVLILSIPAVIWYGPVMWLNLLAACIIVISALYIIDIAFFSLYQLGKDGLLIHRHIGSVLVPYRYMRSLKRGNVRDLLSMGATKRYALSTNCLTISLSQGHYRRISISPLHQQEFINEILHRIDHERASRAALKHSR